MSSLLWDLDYSVPSSPPETPPLHFARSEFRYTNSMSSPMQDDHDNLDWTSSEQVEFTRLNPSRRDGTGEWHMVTATRSLFGSERGSQRDELQAGWNSLPRAHFLQPKRESSAFSPYTKDFWLNGKDAQNIAEFYRTSSKPNTLTQPGFYSPRITRSKRGDTAQSTEYSLKRSSTNNTKEFNAHTLPLPCSKTGVLKLSKPQKVKTSVVETPPLMRAVISQNSPNSDQLSKKDFSFQLQLREDHQVKNVDKSLSNLQEHNMKLPRSDQFVWSRSQPSPSLYQNQDISAKDHLSINTHLFPERQSVLDQAATLSPGLQKASQEGFNLSVDGGNKSPQDDLDQPHASLIQPNDCSKKQKTHFTQHHEDGDVRNSCKNHAKSQVDMNSKNVFGQPRMIASLRAACSPQPVRRSTLLEDLKNLIVMDDTEDGPQGDSSSHQQKEAEICTSPGNLSYPQSPVLTPGHLSMQTCPTECWSMPEQTKSELWERDQDPDPELMSVPNTAYHLDWNSLVQAAQDYETQRMATLLSALSPVPSRPESPSPGTSKIHHSNIYYTGEDTDDVFVDFPDQLSHLEEMLRRLSNDLLKEKRDKVALLAEVLKLRISNQHLRDESLCAVEQLHKISNILNTAPGGVE